MKLEGTLGERPLTSVLQVLGTRSSTGRLKVERSSGLGERILVDFRSGFIVAIDSKLRPPDLRMGQLLVKGSYITEENLNDALEASERGRGRLGDVLVARGQLDGIILGDLLQLQMLEDLFDAIRWAEGTFHFKEGPLPNRLSPCPPVAPRDFLSQCLKHLDNWDNIEHLIPDRGVAFVKTVDALDEQVIVSGRLTSEDIEIFGHVNPTRTVAALLPVVRTPSFELYASLERLTHARVIERHYGSTFEDSHEPSTPASEAPKKVEHTRVQIKEHGARTFSQNVAYHGVTAATVAIVIGLSIVGYLDYRRGSVEAQSEATVDGTANIKNALATSQMEKIRNAIKVHQVNHGEYPLKLETLVDEGLLTKDDLTYPSFERSYVYRPQAESFLLVRPKK